MIIMGRARKQGRGRGRRRGMGDAKKDKEELDGKEQGREEGGCK